MKNLPLLLIVLFLTSSFHNGICQSNSNLSGYYDIEFGTTKNDVAKELTKRSIRIDTNYNYVNLLFYDVLYPNSYIHITDRIEFLFEDFILDIYFLFDKNNSNKFFEAHVNISKFYETIPKGEKSTQKLLDVLVSKYGQSDSIVNTMEFAKVEKFRMGREQINYWLFLNGSIEYIADYTGFYKTDLRNFTAEELKREGGDLRIKIIYEDKELSKKYFDNKMEEYRIKNEKEDEIQKSKF